MKEGCEEGSNYSIRCMSAGSLLLTQMDKVNSIFNDDVAVLCV